MTNWKMWNLKKKQLKKIEPKCTCGKKNPKNTFHSASCEYLKFWNKEFMNFIKPNLILEQYK